jgi:hypothetical protein
LDFHTSAVNRINDLWLSTSSHAKVRYSELLSSQYLTVDNSWLPSLSGQNITIHGFSFLSSDGLVVAY